MSRKRIGDIYWPLLSMLGVLAILIALLVPTISIAIHNSRVAQIRSRIGVPATPDAERTIEELVNTVEVPPVYTALLPGQYAMKLRIPDERHHEVTGGMVQMALFRAGERWAAVNELSIVPGSEHFEWSYLFCEFTFTLEQRQ